ncbi:MAG: class I SAM-dependent methyltransferase [Vibrionaceae bacterium]|nr:class I SAM-dependent methyltransferase [Vibrionaceae bacterium]
MRWLDRLRIVHYHRKRLRAFGSDRARALGWQDKFSQLSRFEALCAELRLDDASILDIGCGYGDLLWFLETNDITPKRYIGIDQQKSFVADAKNRNFNTPADFICADFSTLVLPRCDYVFASGSLNYQSSNENHTVEMITRMYQAAEKGCAFNLLDEAKLPSMKMLASHNKQGVLRYCRWLCPDAQLIEGYSDHDFTITMIKKAKSV